MDDVATNNEKHGKRLELMDLVLEALQTNANAWSTWNGKVVGQMQLQLVDLQADMTTCKKSNALICQEVSSLRTLLKGHGEVLAFRSLNNHAGVPAAETVQAEAAARSIDPGNAHASLLPGVQHNADIAQQACLVTVDTPAALVASGAFPDQCLLEIKAQISSLCNIVLELKNVVESHFAAPVVTLHECGSDTEPAVDVGSASAQLPPAPVEDSGTVMPTPADSSPLTNPTTTSSLSSPPQMQHLSRPQDLSSANPQIAAISPTVSVSSPWPFPSIPSTPLILQDAPILVNLNVRPQASHPQQQKQKQKQVLSPALRVETQGPTTAQTFALASLTPGQSTSSTRTQSEVCHRESAADIPALDLGSCPVDNSLNIHVQLDSSEDDLHPPSAHSESGTNSAFRRTNLLLNSLVPDHEGERQPQPKGLPNGSPLTASTWTEAGQEEVTEHGADLTRNQQPPSSCSLSHDRDQGNSHPIHTASTGDTKGGKLLHLTPLGGTSTWHNVPKTEDTWEANGGASTAQLPPWHQVGQQGFITDSMPKSKPPSSSFRMLGRDDGAMQHGTEDSIHLTTQRAQQQHHYHHQQAMILQQQQLLVRTSMPLRNTQTPGEGLKLARPSKDLSLRGYVLNDNTTPAREQDLASKQPLYQQEAVMMGPGLQQTHKSRSQPVQQQLSAQQQLHAQQQLYAHQQLHAQQQLHALQHQHVQHSLVQQPQVHSHAKVSGNAADDCFPPGASSRAVAAAGSSPAPRSANHFSEVQQLHSFSCTTAPSLLGQFAPPSSQQSTGSSRNSNPEAGGRAFPHQMVCNASDRRSALDREVAGKLEWDSQHPQASSGQYMLENSSERLGQEASEEEVSERDDQGYAVKFDSHGRAFFWDKEHHMQYYSDSDEEEEVVPDVFQHPGISPCQGGTARHLLRQDVQQSFTEGGLGRSRALQQQIPEQQGGGRDGGGYDRDAFEGAAHAVPRMQQQAQSDRGGGKTKNRNAASRVSGLQGIICGYCSVPMVLVVLLNSHLVEPQLSLPCWPRYRPPSVIPFLYLV